MAHRSDPPTPHGLVLKDGAWDDLRRLYRTPPRAYHSFGHVREVLEHWDAVDAEGLWVHRAETWLAVLLHDAVYTPGDVDNEARSAELVRGFAATFGPVPADRDASAPDLAMAEHLVRLTARHGRLKRKDVTDEEALFLDCDMAILGSPPERFDAYDAGIREEYVAVVPEVLLDRARRQFRQQLLGSSRIFLSQRFHDRYEAQARENLERTLER